MKTIPGSISTGTSFWRNAIFSIRRLGVLLLAVLCLATPAARAEDGASTERPDLGPLSPERMAERIERHRTALATVVVTDSAGRPLANRSITVEQTGHRFLFGCNIFGLNPSDTSQLQTDYQRRFAGLLNFATLPFYWGSYERSRSAPQVDRLRAMAQWCRENDLTTKGHPLCWHEVVPQWTSELALDEVHRLQLARITREVEAFAGQIEIWDVVNEAVVMPEFSRRENAITALSREIGRVPLIVQTFEAAQKANPQAALILNDYDTSERYERLIEECLEAGVPIEAIGIQSHMHTRYHGGDWAWNVCERFARFGKPLHFTETTIVSGRIRSDVRWGGPRHDDWPTTPEGERRQAEQVEEFYRVLFSHPAVEAITWWDFSDRGAWMGAPSGLIRADMSPKPAYERLMSLIKGEWWTGRQTLTTDAQGRATFRGYLGRYAVQSADGTAAFTLDQPGEVALKVAVRP